MIQSECFVFPFFRFRQRFLLSPKCSSKDIHSRLDLSALNQCVGVCVYECVYWNVFQFEPFRLADAVAQRRTLKIKNSKICTRNTWDKGACDERCSFIIYNLRSSRINRSLIFFVAHLLMVFFSLLLTNMSQNTIIRVFSSVLYCNFLLLPTYLAWFFLLCNAAWVLYTFCFPSTRKYDTYSILSTNLS